MPFPAFTFLLLPHLALSECFGTSLYDIDSLGIIYGKVEDTSKKSRIPGGCPTLAGALL